MSPGTPFAPPDSPRSSGLRGLLGAPRIALLPGRAALAAGGPIRQADSTQAGWAGALAALDGLLAQAKARGTASVTLSHHFTRLFLLPAPAAWIKPAEMGPWLADRLKDTLDAGADWHYAWRLAPPGQPILVAALAKDHLAELTQTLGRHGLRAGQARPWLSAAWARRRRRLGGASGWYALLEPGQLVLLRLHRGQARSLRQRQLGQDAGADFQALLTRETLLAGGEVGGPVWLERTGVSLDRQALAGGQRLEELAGPQDPAGALLS